MLLIYTSNVTARVQYTFDIIFKHVLKTEYLFTADKEAYFNHIGAKFSYGPHKEVEGLFFGAANILYEEDIYKHQLEAIEWNGIKGFFPIIDLGFLPFDAFASSFYMVSRYEEYTALHKDKYHRYLAEESLCYTYNLLDKPMVNLYALEIKKILESFYPTFRFPELKYKYVPTFDIDVAYLYSNKGILRSTIAFAEDLVKLKFSNCLERILTALKVKQDPYDSYKKQIEISDKFNLHPLYFILLGDFGGNDKNIPHYNKNYSTLIKKLHEKYEACFHPSFGSTRSDKQLALEKNRLEKITGSKTTKSRQFFNKLNLPTYYQRLVALGVTDDYSMGYHKHLGFRASICTPFPFFDLEQNQATTLMVHPFCIVDKCFKLHLRIRSSEVVYHSRLLKEAVKAVGGDFSVIFHNETLGTKKMWQNWRNIYHDISKMANE
ncbi:MAG: hypothetical protein RL711_79 [Bacteroidota bacterium]|jgi:hypothetical protein